MLFSTSLPAAFVKIHPAANSLEICTTMSLAKAWTLSCKSILVRQCLIHQSLEAYSHPSFHPDHVQAMVNLGEGPQQNVTSPPWKFIFEIGQAEIEGGIILLRNSYLNVLNNLYNQCLLLQIIQLVIAVVLAALYVIIMVLPFVRDAWVETRRIAELLAQLPPEIDVESLVSRTMTTAKKVTAQRAGSASIMSRRGGGGDDDDGLLVSAPSVGRMGPLARKQSTSGFDF